jgi:hypothetical protein
MAAKEGSLAPSEIEQKAIVLASSSALARPCRWRGSAAPDVAVQPMMALRFRPIDSLQFAQAAVVANAALNCRPLSRCRWGLYSPATFVLVSLSIILSRYCSKLRSHRRRPKRTGNAARLRRFSDAMLGWVRQQYELGSYSWLWLRAVPCSCRGRYFGRALDRARVIGRVSVARARIDPVGFRAGRYCRDRTIDRGW